MLACLIAQSILAAGCDEDPGAVRPTTPESPLSSNLQSNCYSWPEREFAPDNVAVVQASLPAGSPAVEFCLRDLDGNVYRLSGLLKDKPVLLVLGAYS